MLARIRKSSDNLIVRIILILIAVSFLGAGAASFLQGNSQGEIVEFDNIDPISVEDFEIAKRRVINNIQHKNNVNLTEAQITALGIDQHVLGELINNAIVEHIAKTYDFNISEKKILAYIKKNPVFHDEFGKFDLNVFRSFFNNNQLQENEYLSSIKEQITYRLISDIFIESFMPSYVATDNMINYFSEIRLVDTISINLEYKPKNHKPSVVTSDQISEFYEKNKSLFIAPELRSFDYIVIDKGYFESKIRMSDEILKTYFEENKEDFASGNFHQAKAEIKLIVTQNKIEDLVNETVKSLDEDVSAGLNISEIAAKYNIKVNHQANISLTEISQDQKKVYSPIGDNIFELLEGELSYPIEVQNPERIVLTEIKTISHVRQKELTKASNEIKNLLEQRQLISYNINKLEEIKKTYVTDKVNYTKLKELGISVSQKQKYVRADLDQKNNSPQELITSIFNTNLNNASKLVHDGHKMYFVYIRDILSSKEETKKTAKKMEKSLINDIRTGVFQELIAYLAHKNNMKISIKK